MDDMRDLMAPYVMDALDDDERRRFELYLADHPELADELATMRAGIEALADEGAAQPPASLRAAVLDAIADTPQEQVAPVPGEPRPSPLRRWIAAAAFATAAATAVVVAVSVGGGALTSDDVFAAGDRQSVTAQVGTSGDSRLDYSIELAAAVVTFEDLPDVEDDETFQLWVIDDDGPTSAGLFRPAPGQTQVLLDEPVAPGVVVGLTVEPAGGSLQPTGDILATWSVSA
jgi:anti-sigma-K factor RskA